jgi:hypothetical protein
VIKNFVNIELFHKADVMQEDCLGWITSMEMAGTDLRTILKDQTAGISVVYFVVSIIQMRDKSIYPAEDFKPKAH